MDISAQVSKKRLLSYPCHTSCALSAATGTAIMEGFMAAGTWLIPRCWWYNIPVALLVEISVPLSRMVVVVG